MKKINKYVFLILISVFLSSCYTHKIIYIKDAPPKKRVEIKIEKTHPDAVWITGHWKWVRKKHDYIWVPGHWVKPKKHRIWIPGSWEKTRRGWFWLEGYWK